jgi:aryl sulfotransferase
MLVRPALREYRSWTSDSRYWDAYEARPGDIIIATAPKCGTTWAQQIVSSLVFKDAQVRQLAAVSPWVDARFRFTAEEARAVMEALPHRRFPKTHLPMDGLPLFDEVKYLHVARDGRDAAMSMHNHFTGFSDEMLARFDAIGREDPVIGRPYERPPADVADYFRRWIAYQPERGPVAGPPSPHFFDLEASYWGERRRSNVLLVHYADLSQDLEGEMRRIAEFLEIQIGDSLWPSLVRAARFEAMQAAGEQLMPQTRVMFTDGSKRFFNKGVNGRWRGVLTAADLALYEAKVCERLTPGLAMWLERGRNATGDPRTAPD